MTEELGTLGIHVEVYETHRCAMDTEKYCLLLGLYVVCVVVVQCFFFLFSFFPSSPPIPVSPTQGISIRYVKHEQYN